MKPAHRFLATLVVALLMPSAQASEFEQVPLDQIRAEIGPACAVRPTARTVSLLGNNGFRVERWVMATCNGTVRYDVSYYPSDVFPDRDSAYEIRRIRP